MVFQLLLTDGEEQGSMSGPDAKRRSVAYVLVFCPTAEVLLDRKELHIHVTVEVPGIILGGDRE